MKSQPLTRADIKKKMKKFNLVCLSTSSLHARSTPTLKNALIDPDSISILKNTLSNQKI